VLGGAVDDEAPPRAEVTESEAAPPAPVSAPTGDSPDDRLDRIEREFDALRAELAKLREALGESD
jgi:hypothetical protein